MAVCQEISQGCVFLLLKDQNLTTWNICALASEHACVECAVECAARVSLLPSGNRLVNQQNVSLFGKLLLLFWVGRKRKSHESWVSRNMAGGLGTDSQDEVCLSRAVRDVVEPTGETPARWKERWTGHQHLQCQPWPPQ